MPHLPERDFALVAAAAAVTARGGVDDDLAPNESLFLGGGRRTNGTNGGSAISYKESKGRPDLEQPSRC